MTTWGTPPVFDDLFGSLPPFGSAAYREHVEGAPMAELPAEVLARAYRVLLEEGYEEAARVTLARLLGVRGGRPEYLGRLLYLAARHVPPNQGWQDAQDLFQDAVALILEVLPAPRGRLAEHAWTAFCYQRLIDAWRVRQGRRGERREPARAELSEALEPFEPSAAPLWPTTLGPDRAGWLEGFVRRTLERIADPFIRGVAEDQWLSGDPSPISGRHPSANGQAPLTERFGKSRFQVHRALTAARTRLFAELETQDEMEIDLEVFRRKLASPCCPSPARRSP